MYEQYEQYGTLALIQYLSVHFSVCHRKIYYLFPNENTINQRGRIQLWTFVYPRCIQYTGGS